jgi:hypothetical protein
LGVPVLAWVAFTTSQGRSPVNTVHAPTGHGPSSGFHVFGFLSYVWQFYLPRAPFLSRFHPIAGLGVYDVWLKQGWATFGWGEVQLPPWVYALLGAATAFVGVAGVSLALAGRAVRRLPLLGFFALVLLGLLFGLHLTEYRAVIGGQGALLQGRYLLPVVGLFGLTVALIVVRIPRRWRGMTAGAIVAALLLLQVLSLATVAKVYYT